MRFLKYFTLAFAAVAIAAPATKAQNKPNGATIVSDISVLRQKNDALYKGVLPFNGGLFGLVTALQISRLGNDVSKAIQQTIKDAKAANPFTDQEAINIGLAVNDLNPEVIRTLDTFKSKRAAFDNPFRLSGIVRNNLRDQKKITQQLSDAISAKVPEQFRALSAQFSQPVLAKFDEVIAAFS